jgi:hypothetical protein
MKKIFLTAGICLVSFLGLQAQQTMSSTATSGPTVDQRVDKLLKKLTTTCNLTPDQVTKAKPIVEETVKAKMANKQQCGSDKAKLKAANQATMTAENAKMNAILNADQQAKLAAFEKERATAAQKRQAGASTTNHE